MRKTLMIDFEKCSGCRLCIYACSFAKEGLFSTSRSRISIISLERERIFIPVTCKQCEEPICMTHCPTEAIRKNPDGVVVIDNRLCKGCGNCLSVCPFDAISIDAKNQVALKCDLCQGDPECVRFCVTGAIQYVRVDRAEVAGKWDAVEKQLIALKGTAASGGV